MIVEEMVIFKRQRQKECGMVPSKRSGTAGSQ